MRLTAEEKELLESVERDEWQRADNFAEQVERFQTVAKSTVRKDKRVNIRISERDLEKLKIKALEEGLPYQTLISSILHKYVAGRLTEGATANLAPETSRAIERVRVGLGLTEDELLTIVREQQVGYGTEK